MGSQLRVQVGRKVKQLLRELPRVEFANIEHVLQDDLGLDGGLLNQGQ
jgi:hypothetical protein